MHITNCCANSSDRDAFAGEIVIEDLFKDPDYAGSVVQDMSRILSGLVSAAAPFLEAQRSADHFEYMGCDFMVSADGRAWLLECNCPPSQDTATGLAHAEAVHDGVIGDIIDAFVLPQCLGGGSGVGRGKSGSEEEEEEEEEEEKGTGGLAATAPAATGVLETTMTTTTTTVSQQVRAMRNGATGAAAAVAAAAVASGSASP